MSNITWNGEKLENYGIIIEKIPPLKKAKTRFKTYTIPGRDGILWVNENTLEPITLSLECHFNENVGDTDMYNTLLKNEGRLSLDGVRYYDAFISNNIDYDKVQNFRKFLLTFTMNPVAHEFEERTFTFDPQVETNVLTLSDYEYTNYPIIEIDGRGELIITIEHSDGTGELFTILADGNGAYTLDCESKEITRRGVNCSNVMSGIFPTLKPTDNSIRVSQIGTLTSLNIKYHRAFY